MRVMRVPPEPGAPPGSNARVFRAGRRFLLYKYFQWLVSQISALIGLLFALYWVSRVDFAIPPFS